MSFGIRMECWGAYACFTRPEMKVERVSYDVMTPSAARGLIEAIYWHPGLRYVIDEIAVLSPIKMTNIRRNEVNSKISATGAITAVKNSQRLCLATQRDRTQRAATVLKDVHYCISFHFEMTNQATPSDNPGKFKDILTRRLRRGQCYHQPYFGTREFPASFRLVEDEEQMNPYPVTKDLGYMLYDMDYKNPQDVHPMFFHAMLNKGVMDVRNCEVHQ
ncbi:MAG: pre-crRNA processing endonuclease [Succiniclasticum sp.]|jgi:CRISPR-associated protein Cas5d